jgi:ABC-type amino acid transport substrate-binding protein
MKGVYLFLFLILSFVGCRKNDKNTLIVYTAADFKPYEYEDVNKNIVGIDIDIIREVGKIIKKNIEIQYVNFESLLPGLLINKADLVIAALRSTEERAKTVAFSQPYCTTKLGIMTRVENKIESLENFKNHFLNLCWPIGSYYWTNKNISPETLFGGKWQKIEGKFIYAADNNRKVDSIGGQEKVTLSIKEMPQHNHNLIISGCISDGYKEFKGVCSNGSDSSYILNQYGYEDNYTAYAGESQSHENMPPYIAAFCWKRIE